MGIQSIGNVTGYAANQSVQALSKNTVGTSSGQTVGTVQDVVQLSQASGSSTASIEDIYYDEKDLNKDGFVSYLEELIYALKHPGEALLNKAQETAGQSTGTVQYNQQGALNAGTGNGSGVIDITV
ncbi:MAG TPA: hypothetical protein PLT09_00505 [Deltaproteobacteria bacterium]|nr:hypothetical protein [Deltaproteobacteria bacterium]HPR54200.1 hypothetical protein [Deltaproteobacteria bacterium]HXK45889.1 hypothetical protein [Deltaproteobacteria bacterium]